MVEVSTWGIYVRNVEYVKLIVFLLNILTISIGTRDTKYHYDKVVKL